MATIDTDTSSTQPRKPGFSVLRWWHGVPLYLRILVAMVLGVFVGVALGPRAAWLNLPAKLIIGMLKLIAAPLILFAILNALITARIGRRVAGRLFFLLVLNTCVAILIGLVVANVIRPGKWADRRSAAEQAAPPKVAPGELGKQFASQLPASFVAPFVDNAVIGIVLLAVPIGIALRRLNAEPAGIAPVPSLVDVGFRVLVVFLHWVIDLIPFAVFGMIAFTVGTRGFRPFVGLAAFVVAVLVALSLQFAYYLVRIRIWSWPRPLHVVRGMRDALVMAFSTDSSTATMPVTFECLKTRVGLREESASIGALVGANFNNDGTALYEAMSALFIAQLLGIDLTVGQQLLVMLMSIIASVGAAGIPEAGLVTMPLVFMAVRLPPEYIAFLIPVDWFLDRCRTMVNVMGDVNVSCMLEGRERGPAIVSPVTSPTDTKTTSSA